MWLREGSCPSCLGETYARFVYVIARCLYIVSMNTSVSPSTPSLICTHVLRQEPLVADLRASERSPNLHRPHAIRRCLRPAVIPCGIPQPPAAASKTRHCDFKFVNFRINSD
jgi:hypothetical protein